MRENPIKRNKHIFRLSKDHHFTLLFCWKIRQGLKNGVETERIKNYVHYFWHHDMQAHFREEDEILFSDLRNDDKVRKAVEEHRQIEDQIDNLFKSFDEEKTGDQLLNLANTVDAHVRYEERNLFPYLEKTLTEAQLEAIGLQLKEQPALFDIYEDEFWIKKIKA
jgi:hemerythrin-like domain-containing protein